MGDASRFLGRYMIVVRIVERKMICPIMVILVENEGLGISQKRKRDRIQAMGRVENAQIARPFVRDPEVAEVG